MKKRPQTDVTKDEDERRRWTADDGRPRTVDAVVRRPSSVVHR
jgi:hypothetical protein